MALKLVHPSTIIIAGPTGCGKTQFVEKIITNRMFHPWPTKIIWIYSEWQGIYQNLDNVIQGIQFQKGFSSEFLSKIDPMTRNLLVIDDQMADAADNREMMDIFTKGSHHRNLSLIFIVQNLFQKGSVMRTLSLNTQYYVLFKSPRDKSQIRSLSAQMYPGLGNFLVDSFEDATKEPYGYLLIDLRPETPEEYRVRTRIFPNEATEVYAPSKLPKRRN